MAPSGSRRGAHATASVRNATRRGAKAIPYATRPARARDALACLQRVHGPSAAQSPDSRNYRIRLFEDWFATGFTTLAGSLRQYVEHPARIFFKREQYDEIVRVSHEVRLASRPRFHLILAHTSSTSSRKLFAKSGEIRVEPPELDAQTFQVGSRTSN
jgi:hypothetical protein